MKRLLLPALALAVIGVILFWLLVGSASTVSDQQQQTLDLWGNPAQFVITYLPQDSASGSSFARYEVWYYPEQNKQVTFLAGETLAVQDFSSEETVPASPYVPWDFDFDTGYRQLQSLIGADNLYLIDLPGFSGDGIESYAAQDLVLVLEDDYLTYVQTLAYDENIEANPQESDPRSQSAEPAANPEPTSNQHQETTIQDQEPALNQDFQTYSSTDLGFSINYPVDWFLTSGVLANYDTDYLYTGASLPEQMLKCDFVEYRPDEVTLGELQLLSEGRIQVSQTTITADIWGEGPGYGDNVVFLIEDDEHQPMNLVCFAYDDSFYDQLLATLQTFEFLD